MLTVGIHENVRVSKAVLNDQGTLEIEFKQPGSDDAMGALTGNAELSPDQTINIRVYPQNVDYFGESREGSTMLKLITGFKAILVELLRVYIDNPNIDATKGLTISQETAGTFFTDQKNVDVAYANIVGQFVALIEPFVETDDNDVTPFRVKLPRRSKKYSFPALPAFGPWVESSEIPQENSKLKWTNWEITNGKNDPTPATDSVDTTEAQEALDKVNDVFND